MQTSQFLSITEESPASLSTRFSEHSKFCFSCMQYRKTYNWPWAQYRPSQLFQNPLTSFGYKEHSSPSLWSRWAYHLQYCTAWVYLALRPRPLPNTWNPPCWHSYLEPSSTSTPLWLNNYQLTWTALLSPMGHPLPVSQPIIPSTRALQFFISVALELGPTPLLDHNMTTYSPLKT